MWRYDPQIKRTLRRLRIAFVACTVGLAVVTFAGASDALLLVLSPTVAGGFTLFVVLRLMPMADAVERRLAQDGAAERPVTVRRGSAAPDRAARADVTNG